jgi:23S rRNA (uracil1939-C5)-methyltransferase
VATGDPLRLVVERLTFGFDALAHHDGQVVFVPYGAPGDRVVAEIAERHRTWLRARVLAVEVGGPDRVAPGCPYFPTCGGCQWQHVAPPAQRRAKAALVAEQLDRLGGLRGVEVLPAVDGGLDWGYRARVTLAVEGRRAGLLRARSHALVEVDACPIADPAISAHLAAARAWLEGLRVPLRRLTVAAVPCGVVLVGAASAPPGPADEAASLAVLRAAAGVRGTVLVCGTTRQVTGDPTVRVELEPDLALEVPADAFTQVNPAANRRLVAATVAFAAVGAGDRVLDLYCGAGNFALPLARRGGVVHGIERDPVAVDAARANAARLGLSARFDVAAVADGLGGMAPGSADVVVLDPPRAGAADAVARIAALRAPRILYVSCDPATLARDARALVDAGYALARVQPVDLFPQTYHVESVAELRLT